MPCPSIRRHAPLCNTRLHFHVWFSLVSTDFLLLSSQIKTGVEGKNVAFLFTDTQIVVETMLEDLNNVLNSGEIPNLFPQDEQVIRACPKHQNYQTKCNLSYDPPPSCATEVRGQSVRPRSRHFF